MYPVPSLPYHVDFGIDYPGVIYIDDGHEDDPVIVWSYDTWSNTPNVLTNTDGNLEYLP